MMTLTYAARTCSKLVYRASQFEADAQIGRLLDTLDKRGLSDNTMVIFSGVNTLHVSSLRRCSLCSLFSLCLPSAVCDLPRIYTHVWQHDSDLPIKAAMHRVNWRSFVAIRTTALRTHTST